ncbi:MAG: hypothetical protein R3B99_35525 [Polyangiales bacterium]
MKGSGERYDMRRTYGEGDFFVHPKFGVGKVVAVPEAQPNELRLRGRQRAQLVHARG